MEIDSIGGELNAFTSCENTTFYIKVLDEYLGKALELLTDIFLNSTFQETEIEKEKGVITEEINMVEDTRLIIFTSFSAKAYGEMQGQGSLFSAGKRLLSHSKETTCLIIYKNITEQRTSSFPAAAILKWTL